MSGSGRDRIVAGWNRFFHEPTSPLALGLFRIVFAACLFAEVDTTRAKSPFAIASDAFHLPYFDWLQPIPETLYHTLHDVQYPLIVLFGLGLFTRLAGWPLLAIQAWVFFTDQLNFRNHPYFFMLLLLLMLLSPCDEAVSIRALWRGWRQRVSWFTALLGRDRPPAFQRLIQLSLCVAYFYAGLHKAHPAYFSGRILERKIADEVYDRTSGDVLSVFFTSEQVDAFVRHPVTMISASWATVLLELLLPFLLWHPRTRVWSILVGVGFHLSIRFTMEITTFSYTMIGIYLLFLAPTTLTDLAVKLAGRLGVRRPAIDLPRPT